VIAALLAVALGAAPASPRVVVEVLERVRPRTLEISGRTAHAFLAARGDRLLVDGRRVAQPWRLPEGRWRVAPARGEARTYRGAVEVRAARGRLHLRLAMELEEYVGAVVASEMLAGTHPEALAAQAVVVRSYALASRGRHPGDALCDLAHCQVLRAHGHTRRHAAAARRAARATAGEVLRLSWGPIAEAPFHAACGGHTADPREVFGGDGTGAEATPDPGCPLVPWLAAIEPGRLAGAIRGIAGRSAAGGRARVPPRLRARDVALAFGEGGWVIAAAGRDGAWEVTGDAFARAIDRELGFGAVRSGRLRLSDEDGRVVLRGTGSGHGVGLCQAGAARRAKAGEDHRAILRAYFPRAEVASLDAPIAEAGPGGGERRDGGGHEARLPAP
jgi:stage II sporulation protein D